MIFDFCVRQSRSVCSAVAVVLLLLLAAILPAKGHAQVFIDKSCALTEDMYVLTLDNDNHIARTRSAEAEMDAFYSETKNGPPWLWGNVKASNKRNYGNEKKTRIVVLIDTLKQNISLLISSEHLEDDLIWETDNLSFIDGKTNAYADFYCKGHWIQLKWKNRDFSSPYEHFDSSSGILMAKSESFINESDQSDLRLRIAKLEIDYPLNGLYGNISNVYKKLVQQKKSTLHSYAYDIRNESSADLIMHGKYRLGYKTTDDQFQLNSNVKILATMNDESSSQNLLSPIMPISPTSARAYLASIERDMNHADMKQMRAVYNAKGLPELINEADTLFEKSEHSIGSERNFQMDNAAKQINEISARLKQVDSTYSNTIKGRLAHTTSRYKAKKIIQQINMIQIGMTKRRNAAHIRSEALEDHQEQIFTESNIIDETELEQFEDYMRDSPFREIPKRTGKTRSAPDEPLETCLMTKNQEGIFGYVMNDRHYGFDVGFNINLLGSGKWVMSLESTRTPWTMLWQTYGGDLQVPSKHTWCHGPFFGVDYTQSTIRLTVRGIYDPINNTMYTASMWSIWDNSLVLAHLHALVTSLLLPGLPLMFASLATYYSLPTIVLALMGSTAALGTTPMAPSEVRWDHMRFFTKFAAEHGLGDIFYTGSDRMTYYSSFGTLKSKGDIN